MPVQPDPSQNFIHALSDFWSVFFKDTTQIQSFYKGVEINIGQIYLELLETVLGTNLLNAPVFSRQYYKPFTIGEDELLFQEGASLDTDRYVYTPSNYVVQDVASLMNRVIDPTRLLETGRDYDVADGALRFRNNILDTDGLGTALEFFPVRTVSKLFLAEYRDLARRNWRYAGVRTGDSLRFRRLGGGTALTSRIIGVREDTLLLGSTRPEYASDLRRHSFRVTALRRPFDATKSGLVLSQHPNTVERLSGNPTDAALMPGTTSLDLSSEPYYRGLWAALTLYAAGDVVANPSGVPVRSLTAHVSGAAYSAASWDSLATKYVYVHHPGAYENDGLFAVVSTTAATLTLARPGPFTSAGSMRAQAYIVGYPAALIGAVRPQISLDHTEIDAGTLVIGARRKHPVFTPGLLPTDPWVLHPENETVVEGVDYTIDNESGTLTVLSGWDPLFAARASYTWLLSIVSYTHTYRGTWSGAGTYAVGDLVVYVDGLTYISRTALTPFSSANWAPFSGPFSFNTSHPVRQIALWGADVLLDLETLYKNFGYLLAFKHPSSEQYREFLRGVSQLFVIGPALERFESALNVMTGLPVVRDDGEVLRAYDDGIAISGADGEVIDTDEGRDGALFNATSQFSSPTATFFRSDVGAVLRVLFGASSQSYLVTSVISTTTVTVSPTPPDSTALVWNFAHVALTRRFRTGSYLFTAEDQDALIIIEDASNSRNNGRFRIESVENPSTVILEAPYGFTDEINLHWKLSRSKIQTVTTSRAAYRLPLWVPVRSDIAQPGSIDTLTFEAFSTLTDAFHVTDYLQDPTWWHNLAIPPNIVSFATESSARRRATPAMIEHGLNPLDDALVGDFGLTVGADDEGRPGIPRSGPAVWYGGDAIALTFPATTPGPTSRDLGRYVTVEGLGWRIQFPITGIEAGGTILRLGAFPSPEMRGAIPPVPLTATLSPLLYRRTVGFVMMDRFLKYHALRIEVNLSEPLTPTFVGEATQLFREAKPAYTNVYLGSPLDFLDRMLIDDSRLNFGVGLPLLERVRIPINAIHAGPPGLLRTNDAFRFATAVQTIPSAPGVYFLTPAVTGSDRFHVVKGWFDLTVLVGDRRITEGVDYTLDREGGKLLVLAPGLPAATDFNYVIVILGARTSGTLDATIGETEICVAGADPALWWAPGQSVEDAGLIDRAVQLTIGP